MVNETVLKLYGVEVERMYRCRARYVRTERVDAAKVHAFTLVGHAKTNTCTATLDSMRCCSSVRSSRRRMPSS